MNYYIHFLILVLFLNGCGSSNSTKNTTNQPINRYTTLPIVIIGPSTVNTDYGYTKTYHKDATECHQIVGWGEVFSELVKDKESVYNFARAGSSAKSFRDAPHTGWADEVHPESGHDKPYNILFGPNKDHYWDGAKTKMKELKNGILLIQFGGNDAHHLANEYPTRDKDGNIIDRNGDNIADSKDIDITWQKRYNQFKTDLKFYINQANELNFTPILITSPNGRFIENGVIKNSRGDYPRMMKELAKEEEVTLLDFHQKTMSEYAKYTTQEEMDKKFDACFDSANNQDRIHFYSYDLALEAANWIKDLACSNDSAKLLCEQLK